MRTCARCKMERDILDFNKDKYSKDGINSWCRNCTIEKLKNHRNKNKEEFNKKQKEYCDKNRERIREYKKKYYHKNSEEIDAKNKIFKLKNKEHYTKYNNEYVKNRFKIDILFKLRFNIRTLIRSSISSTGYKKNTKTEQILGCSFVEFKEYLESKFEHWMNWENRGLYNGELNYGWDIDHIVPLASAKTEEDIIKLNHYSNLQPLCSKINRDIKRNNMYFV